ncbi:MAG TPA: hypothetical protein VGN42_09270, partial [Pirellulales bacterium]|nr:hypothetical protein [Pirellulales bacterium]
MLEHAAIYQLAPTPEQRAWQDRECKGVDPHVHGHVSRGPFPVSPETAAAIEFAGRHRIRSWSFFRTYSIDHWVLQHFIAGGKKAIRPGYPLPYVRPDALYGDRDEVRGRFAKAAKFRKFLAAKDYSHNLADVTDGEFEET